MKQATVFIAALMLLIGCAGPGGEEYAAAGGEAEAAPAAKVEFETPEALPLPEYKSDPTEEFLRPLPRLMTQDPSVSTVGVKQPVTALVCWRISPDSRSRP